MNKVFLIGRLTKEPEYRENEKLKQVKFTLAVNRMKEGADYISCIAWNKTAELISKYLHKGNQTAIEGRIQTGSYEKDGKKIYTTDVVIDNITFIGNSEKVAESTKDDWEGLGSSFKTEDIAFDKEDMPF